MIEEMMEGSQYPELRNARWVPIEMRRRTYLATDWYMGSIRESSMPAEQVETIKAVRLEMPLEDANALFEIYRAHYHAASRNPAVREAWLEYRMLVELTREHQ